MQESTWNILLFYEMMKFFLFFVIFIDARFSFSDAFAFFDV